MKPVSIVQDENLAIKVSHQLLPQESQRIDLYFSLPVEMGIDPSTLNEDDYYHSGIKSHCAYYSDKIHLPLVRSRFISQKKGDEGDYRLNLNLYSYQLRVALDTDIKQALQLEDVQKFYTKAIELAEQTQSLLKQLRRYTPSDDKLNLYYENADNYLSWHVEQSFLKLIARGPKSSEFADIKTTILEWCEQENEYRKMRKYNSQLTLSDPNRIANKMRLLQRLIEYGVVFKRNPRFLNTYLHRLVKGGVTAVIMAFVMILVLNARSTFSEVTVALVSLLGIIYGLREIFKEDVTRYIWRTIQKGRPKWQNIFTHCVNKKRIQVQMLWLEYLNKKDLPQQVLKLFQRRRQQNKQTEFLLHFRCDSQVIAKAFLPGYDEINNQFFFNLAPFVRYLKKGEGRLYQLNGNKVSHQGIERRYQINVILVQSNKAEEYAKRYKITLNRSRIINIESMNNL